MASCFLACPAAANGAPPPANNVPLDEYRTSTPYSQQRQLMAYTLEYAPYIHKRPYYFKEKKFSDNFSRKIPFMSTNYHSRLPQ